MPIHRYLLFLLVACTLSPHLSAGGIYKSTDENGKVSYSSSPPETRQKSVKMNIAPAPSDDAVNSAKQRHQKNLRAGEILDDNRQKREQIITDDNRIKREKRERERINIQNKSKQQHEQIQEEGPYYGIPGHGILVLPKGPGISR